MAAEPTTRDALIAEMLGDIGRLHDSVESLKGVLPGQIEEVETKITGLIGLLSKAGDAYRGQLETYTNAQADIVKKQMERDAQEAKARFERDSSDAIRAALGEVERTVKNSVQQLAGQRQSMGQTIGLCILSGLVAASVTATAVLYFF
ncbi:hypothetical protein C662_18723 [Thauera sp. 28]|jgi:Flp pilus assembly protein TadB|uniref:hypothetical protein n=1 Tax=Thauera sp. 28 TaxID=303682 RepID=UPI0002CF2700|nr:hypothetical protein [Thauera sp. 28]ENO90953.1 hypothetical protein C662_18723 [Thauera sp. 28]